MTYRPPVSTLLILCGFYLGKSRIRRTEHVRIGKQQRTYVEYVESRKTEECGNCKPKNQGNRNYLNFLYDKFPLNIIKNVGAESSAVA